MHEDHFQHRFQAYGRWKDTLAEAIQAYQGWLDRHQPGSGEIELRLFDALEALRSDRLTIAVVAEFSRGKTELINALFFADYGRRLLPSEAGRTTMCPTELFYDHTTEQAYIRLLPIETRQEDTSIAEYRRNPVYWTTLQLDIHSPEQMAAALHEVTRVKQVSVATARRLGLYREEPAGQTPPEQVEVPVWRHALISFPHPLLKQGLAVLDTPGLNALGSEPELTLSMLPGAQGLVFLLAADTGVTRSDLELWRNYVTGPHRRHTEGLIVALNKIDTLWDELKDPQTVASSIENQRLGSAEALGLAPDQVFAISAQKALLAKIRRDPELLARSRLAALEHHLAAEVLPAQGELLRANITDQVATLVDNSLESVSARLQQVTSQLQELSALHGKNADVITHLMRKAREEQAGYLKNVEQLQIGRRLLGQQTKALLDLIDVGALDELLTTVRKEMADSWTTAGLRKGMKALFDAARASMEEAVVHAENLQHLVQTLYRKFHEELGFPALTPRPLALRIHRIELERLYEEAEAFRNSPVTAMTEQNFVIKKFFVSLVSHARNLFSKAVQETEAWSRDALTPLVVQIKEHKHLMEQRLETLRRINESRGTLEAKLGELKAQQAELEGQVVTLGQIRMALQTPLPAEPFAADPVPQLARAAM